MQSTTCHKYVGSIPSQQFVVIPRSVLPDFETTSLAITDEQLSPDDAANRGSVRLREIAVKCMVEATAQSRLTIANKTQARRDGREHKFKTGDLVDYCRKPEGLHATDTSGWRGPATICDLTRLTEGSIVVRLNVKVILTSLNTTRPHTAYPVLLMYNAMREPDFLVFVRGAAQAAKGHIRVYTWMETTIWWNISQRA